MTMFQATTLEGWYSLMSMITNGYSKYITIIVFVSAIQICHYLLVNLTLAVMVTNFRKQKEEELDNLIDQHVEYQSRIDERRRQLQLKSKEESKCNMQNAASYCLNTFISYRDLQRPDSMRYEYQIIIWLWKLVIHPLFRGLFIILICLNVFVLSTAD